MQGRHLEGNSEIRLLANQRLHCRTDSAVSLGGLLLRGGEGFCCRSDYMAATQTFAPGGKYPRAATVYRIYKSPIFKHNAKFSML